MPDNVFPFVPASEIPVAGKAELKSPKSSIALARGVFPINALFGRGDNIFHVTVYVKKIRGPAVNIRPRLGAREKGSGVHKI